MRNLFLVILVAVVLILFNFFYVKKEQQKETISNTVRQYQTDVVILDNKTISDFRIKKCVAKDFIIPEDIANFQEAIAFLLDNGFTLLTDCASRGYRDFVFVRNRKETVKGKE